MIQSGTREPIFSRGVQVKNPVWWFSPHPLKSCWLLMQYEAEGIGDANDKSLNQSTDAYNLSASFKVRIIIITIINNAEIRVTLSWTTLQGHFTKLVLIQKNNTEPGAVG